MRKISLIERPIENFREFSISDISNIIGGDLVKCNGSSTTLYCSPFGVGACLSVTIGDITYECALTANLKEGPCVKSISHTNINNESQIRITYF